jgi:hypothetical protein
MTTQLELDRTPLAALHSIERGPTPEQQQALRALGVRESSFRLAAHGQDVFAYVEDDYSTLRLQIAPNGVVVGQTVLEREPRREAV